MIIPDENLPLKTETQIEMALIAAFRIGSPNSLYFLTVFDHWLANSRHTRSDNTCHFFVEIDPKIGLTGGDDLCPATSSWFHDLKIYVLVLEVSLVLSDVKTGMVSVRSPVKY